MSPITFDEAYAATNPADDEEKRTIAAGNIVAGVAANDAYWDSRSRLEALEARATGHGTVAAPPSEDTADSSGLTASEKAAAIDTTETTEPVSLPSPDNPEAAVAKLRAQVASLGGSPEA